MCSSNCPYCAQEEKEAKKEYDSLSKEERALITDLKQIEANARWAKEDFKGNLSRVGRSYVEAYKEYIIHQIDQILNIK